jgi:HAMP domain-containing protein
MSIQKTVESLISELHDIVRDEIEDYMIVDEIDDMLTEIQRLVLAYERDKNKD